MGTENEDQAVDIDDNYNNKESRYREAKEFLESIGESTESLGYSKDQLLHMVESGF